MASIKTREDSSFIILPTPPSLHFLFWEDILYSAHLLTILNIYTKWFHLHFSHSFGLFLFSIRRKNLMRTYFFVFLRMIVRSITELFYAKFNSATFFSFTWFYKKIHFIWKSIFLKNMFMCERVHFFILMFICKTYFNFWRKKFILGQS